jgi:hypothetical protein
VCRPRAFSRGRDKRWSCPVSSSSWYKTFMALAGVTTSPLSPRIAPATQPPVLVWHGNWRRMARQIRCSIGLKASNPPHRGPYIESSDRCRPLMPERIKARSCFPFEAYPNLHARDLTAVYVRFSLRATEVLRLLCCETPQNFVVVRRPV